jgi:hypothetical protein
LRETIGLSGCGCAAATQRAHARRRNAPYAIAAIFDFRLFGTENEIQYSVPQPQGLALKVIAEMTKS